MRFVSAFVVIFIFLFALDAKSQTTAVSGVTESIMFARASEDALLDEDKVDHFLASAYIAVFTYYVLKDQSSLSDESALVAAAGLSFSIGLGKELYDKKSGKGRASCKDIAANLCGIAAGILLFTQN